MGVHARTKSRAGQSLKTITTLLTNGGSLLVPETDNTFLVDVGTVNITGITVDKLRVGRELTFIFIGTVGSITDTAVASSTNGSICLNLAAPFSPVNGSTLKLIQVTNGAWWEISRSVNG